MVLGRDGPRKGMTGVRNANIAYDVCWDGKYREVAPDAAEIEHSELVRALPALAPC
jgi:hypothetical protein